MASVALAPGSFWNAKERRNLKASLLARRQALRLTRHKAGRAVLLAQISAKPDQVPPATALLELRSFTATPTFDDLADGQCRKEPTARAVR